MWLCPDLLTRLTTGRTVVVVSGTNGKTTTTAMIAKGWGGVVTTNATGANMPAGLVAALVGPASSRVVLEVDEAWLPEVIDATHCQVVVLLNLSRDQLDRANEVRHMAERWRQCFASAENADLVVIANASDPLVVFAAGGATNVRWCDVVTPWLDDSRSCPNCTLPLSYESTSWHCSCGFAKPSAMTTTLGDELIVDGESSMLRLSLPGEFNRTNAALAVTALSVVGVAPREAVERISDLRGVAGRFTFRRWGRHTVRLWLAKNPSGFAAILSTIDTATDDVWIAINAQLADGRDPSWLYDVPFERLRGHRVFCLGERRWDLATRLDYAGVQYVVVDRDASLSTSSDPVNLIANYTAFNEWLERSTPC